MLTVMMEGVTWRGMLVASVNCEWSPINSWKENGDFSPTTLRNLILSMTCMSLEMESPPDPPDVNVAQSAC